jgi:hypothetical protein
MEEFVDERGAVLGGLPDGGYGEPLGGPGKGIKPDGRRYDQGNRRNDDHGDEEQSVNPAKRFLLGHFFLPDYFCKITVKINIYSN